MRVLMVALLLTGSMANAQTQDVATTRIDDPDWPTLGVLSSSPTKATEDVIYTMIAGTYRGWYQTLVKRLEQLPPESRDASAKWALRRCVGEIGVDFIYQVALAASKNVPDMPLSVFVIETIEDGCGEELERVEAALTQGTLSRG